MPLPRHIEPMKARLGSLPAADDDYAYEIKWDGVRALAYVEDGRLGLESRNLLDITAQYPELRPLAAEFGSRDAVLDGEIVTFSDDGRPSFQRLQGRMHLGSEAGVQRAMETIPVTYMVFDLLHLDGHSLMSLAYRERRDLLDQLGLSGSAWQAPAAEVGGGADLLEAARASGLEGLVAKRLDSTYLPGKRPGTWIKVKTHLGQEFVVGGWVAGEGRRAGKVGALLLGYYDGPDFVFASKVGTGFTDADLAALERALAPLRRETSPFTRGIPPRQAVFVEPRLVGEVEFTEWTGSGTLRHPSWKGLRNDKDPRDVVREDRDRQG